MILRKVNAWLSLLTAILFLDHAIFLSVWMLSRCSINKSTDALPYVLMALMALHALISIVLAILGHRGAAKVKYKSYPKMNIPTMVQRISGLLILLMMGLHLAGAANYYHPKMLHAILHPLFFALSLAHISVSVGRAMISLGIGSAKAVRAVDTVMIILCGTTLVAAVVGFYLCLFMGVVK